MRTTVSVVKSITSSNLFDNSPSEGGVTRDYILENIWDFWVSPERKRGKVGVWSRKIHLGRWFPLGSIGKIKGKSYRNVWFERVWVKNSWFSSILDPKKGPKREKRHFCRQNREKTCFWRQNRGFDVFSTGIQWKHTKTQQNQWKHTVYAAIT